MKNIILIASVNGDVEEFVINENTNDKEAVEILDTIHAYLDDSTEEDFIRFDEMVIRKNSIICIFSRDTAEEI